MDIMRFLRPGISALLLAAIMQMSGCGKASPTVTELQRWATEHDVVLDAKGVEQEPGISRLAARYSSEGDQVQSFAIRLDPDEEGYEKIASEWATKPPFDRANNPAQSDRWHQYDCPEHLKQFADALDSSKVEDILGKAPVKQTIALLRSRAADENDRRWDGHNLIDFGPWHAVSVDEHASIWQAHMGDVAMRIEFRGVMRGASIVPVELSAAWNGADFVPPDAHCAESPEIPDGVRGFPPFTPKPVVDHLDGGGIVWAVQADPEDSWAGMIPCYSTYFLLDADGHSLSKIVTTGVGGVEAPGPAGTGWVNSDKLKLGREWYEVSDRSTHYQKDGVSLKFTQWDSSATGATTVFSIVVEQSDDGKLRTRTTDSWEWQLSLDAIEGTGRIRQTMREVTEFFQADISPQKTEKSAEARVIRIRHVHPAPEFARVRR